MNTRYTLIMLLAAVALGTFAWMQRDTEPMDYTDGGPTPTPAPLFELVAEDIQEVEVQSPDGDYTVVRVAGGWEIDEQALSDFAGDTIERLATPSVLRYLPEDRDPEEYGFDTPTMTVTLRTADGDAQTIVVGDENPVDPQYYLRLGDDPRIAIVSSSDWSSLKTWITDPPYAPTATPEAVETPATEEDGEADTAAGDEEAGDLESADETGSEGEAAGEDEASSDTETDAETEDEPADEAGDEDASEGDDAAAGDDDTGGEASGEG